MPRGEGEGAGEGEAGGEAEGKGESKAMAWRSAIWGHARAALSIARYYLLARDK